MQMETHAMCSCSKSMYGASPKCSWLIRRRRLIRHRFFVMLFPYVHAFLGWSDLSEIIKKNRCDSQCVLWWSARTFRAFYILVIKLKASPWMMLSIPSIVAVAYRGIWKISESKYCLEFLRGRRLGNLIITWKHNDWYPVITKSFM